MSTGNLRIQAISACVEWNDLPFRETVFGNSYQTMIGHLLRAEAQVVERDPDQPANHGQVAEPLERPLPQPHRPRYVGIRRQPCSTEWDFRRLPCPQCGEEDTEKLPIYTAERFPHVRVEACESCHGYMKAIDLTRNGLAVPEVDELASLALDLWADERGYTKLQTNVFGL